jgi:hypothetical protein
MIATATIPVINPNIKTMNSNVAGSVLADKKAVTRPAKKPTIKIANPNTRKPPRDPSFSRFISDDL